MSDHIPDARKEVDTNLEVIRWRSCEDDPPDHCRGVLVKLIGLSTYVGYYLTADPHMRPWRWFEDDEEIGNIEGAVWAEMPRGPK